VAAGLGAGANFGLSISKDRLAFNCNASLVFGPGAAGGFGTIVDFEKIYDVIKLVCEALADIDYRYLYSVTEEAYKYISYSLFRVATSPGQIVGHTFQLGYEKVVTWWKDRSATRKEAERLTENLLQEGSVVLNGNRISFGKLPPETMGPMLYVLSVSYVDSWERAQENAIVLLLSAISSWHQFVEVLEHMSPNDIRIDAMKSLNRLNAILDGSEQDEFNKFIHNLQESHQGFSERGLAAWTTKSPYLKRMYCLLPRPGAYSMESLKYFMVNIISGPFERRIENQM